MDQPHHFTAQPNAYFALADVLGCSTELTVVDGGAHVGRTSHNLLQVFSHATVHAFEPVVDTFHVLKGHLAAERRARCWNMALGCEAGELPIRVNGCTGTSSLLDSEERLVRYHGDKASTQRKERVQVVCLDDWARDNGVSRVDLIKLDLQGFELEALRGASGLLRSSVSAVYSEAQLVPLYEGAALFSDIDLFLRDHDFELFRIQELFFNGAERRSTCCDAIWLHRDVMAAYCTRMVQRAA
ncbi:MAG: FkbM family methyltransferase [Myxococcota bacterium]